MQTTGTIGMKGAESDRKRADSDEDEKNLNNRMGGLNEMRRKRRLSNDSTRSVTMLKVLSAGIAAIVTYSSESRYS